MRIAYLTAGAAGMYCGSCMHDNTLARALSRMGVDILLIPTYTPIRTDEENVSVDRVFFGGINVFLQQKMPLFRVLPGALVRFLDRPGLIRWAASRGMKTSAVELGALTVSMLRGETGHQRKEVRRLCEYLHQEIRPDLLVLSNILIAGCVGALRKSLPANRKLPILVMLQGDDIFLDELPEPYKSKALAQIQRLAEHVDGFLTHTDFYADHMAQYLGLPRERFHRVPLGLDVTDWQTEGDALWAGDSPASHNGRPPTVGYLARLAKEKGLHVLVDAFIELRRRPQMETAQLRIAGWLGDHQQEYSEQQFEKLRSAGLGDAFHYAGAVDRADKLQFLRSIDVLSVPTTYRDPKGIFVLEALASGVPVVQPHHGAFPELLQATGGGRLTPPNDPFRLADALHELLTDEPGRKSLGQQGREKVMSHFDAKSMAHSTLEVFERFVK